MFQIWYLKKWVFSECVCAKTFTKFRTSFSLWETVY